MRSRRSWTALLAALLLLIPLALSAHAHTAQPHPECAVCVATHHAATAKMPAPALGTPETLATPVVTAVALAPASVDQPVRVGRGPPALLPFVAS
jgi:hypothetical protein